MVLEQNTWGANMIRPRKRHIRICRNCLVHSLAGVAWQMWGARPDGMPRPSRCRTCR
jgi:hypothetical protein